MGPLPLGIARHSSSHDSIGAGSCGGGPRPFRPLNLLGHMSLKDRTNRAGPAVVAATLAADLSPSHCFSATQPDSLRAVNASDLLRDVNIITHTRDGGFVIDSTLRQGPNTIAPLHPGMIGLNICLGEHISR